MLPDLPEVEAALDGPDGILPRPADPVLIISSTSSPTGARPAPAAGAEMPEPCGWSMPRYRAAPTVLRQARCRS
jgi:hypothetical protein